MRWAHEVGSEPAVWAILPMPCRPRHHPYALFAWRQHGDHVRLEALVDVAAGTEVTVAYGGADPPADVIEAAARFGFDPAALRCRSADQPRA